MTDFWNSHAQSFNERLSLESEWYFTQVNGNEPQRNFDNYDTIFGW